MQLEELNKETSRCLGCKVKPCEKACPLGVSPHDFIKAAKEQDFKTAAELILERNPLAQTCGLVCPDKFCQKACIRGKIDTPLAIPCLQAEMMKRGGYKELTLPPYINKKAAVIGGGPAGLGALYEFLKAGWSVDIYDKEPSLGGAARLIPEYRLPKSVLDFEINRLTINDRVHVFLNTEIKDFAALKNKYDAVVLAFGEPALRKQGISGEEHCLPYNDYLTHPEKYQAQKIAVSGGGEVALDCALTAKKNGAQCVEMFVRRRRQDMRISKNNQQELDDNGIIIRDLTSITAVSPQNDKLNLNTVNNTINSEGKAEPCTGTDNCLIDYDLVIQALGAYCPKEIIPEGFVIAGDMTGTNGTVVQALASGRAAAQKILNEDNQ